MRVGALTLPDFIIAGAPRSGTTWLGELLARHPGVRMARPAKPEPKFFLRDDLYEKGLAYYSATWFDGTPPGMLAGEKSTNYLESAQAAERMRRDLPGVKLIFILREPCSRAYSNYLWSRMNGHEELDFETAIAREAEREKNDEHSPLKYARPHSYFSRGLYAELLAPYFERFPRSSILCLRYEEIQDDPAGLSSTLFRFLGLGVAPGIDPTGLGVINAAEGNGDEIPPQVLASLRERYREPNAQLGLLVGPAFKIWKYS